MTRFLMNRVISLFVTLLLIITLTFFLMHVVPGGPFTQEKRLLPAVEEALKEKYNLDDPLYKQYLNYLENALLKKDLGPSYIYEGRRVNEFIKEGFPISARIGIYSILVILVIGIPFGMLSALKHNKWHDTFFMFVTTLGVTIPSFVLATLLLFIFTPKLGFIREYGINLKTWLLPIIALSGYPISFVARLTRTTMLDVLQEDYIRTAKAKGLSESRVIFNHALRNAVLPVISYIGPLIATILTGEFVVEKIFALPGMGRYFVLSIINRDYTTIMGVTIFYAVILIVMIFIVDWIYGLIDPRIKVHN